MMEDMRLQQLFLDTVLKKFSILGFDTSNTTPYMLLRSTTTGHISVAFRIHTIQPSDNRKGLVIKADAGTSIHCIERLFAEFNNEPYSNNEEIFTNTIGGNISRFSNQPKQAYRVFEESEIDDVGQAIMETFIDFALGYLETVAEPKNLLHELRNPSPLTKRLITSALQQSHLIMMTAFCVQDDILLYTVLSQEENLFKTKLASQHASYEKFASFLKQRRNAT